MISAGNYVQVAARACGVSKQRFYDWIAKGDEHADASDEELAGLDDETLLHVWFRDVYKEAEARAEVDLLERVAAAGPRWQAHMTIMQRRFGSRWRDRSEIEDLGEVRQHAVLSAEEGIQELESLAAMTTAALNVARGPESVPPPADV